MGVERVVDPGALLEVERESERRSTCADVFLVERQLLGRRSVLLSDVITDGLAVGRHLRIELEGLEVNINTRLIADANECLLQRSEPDYAPRAGNVGYEVDPEMGGHCIAALLKVRSAGWRPGSRSSR